ncbi:M56 family metallopeptidase [Mangrovibacterium diazotrophicum]|uniref:Beta-lactamase regulating signal transducer with metallopeptidase domain n=1 Tax=Mangrovibacterium diazotrophicum TaxID=1261403 RepID=A0A419WBJ1_9BACT|nr:M56 family metallopeptidase [Mangrovibacterium diazotrophicum]RKD92835.1 beta-lactamase regulating signal transducer with metallopeptidase domain [Mangrovibacterium diazotrophicum]
MEAFLIYLLKSGAALAAFYLFFLLVFRRRKQFGFNRLYLFLAMPVSYLLPLITIKVTATEVVIPQIINTTPTTAAQPLATEAATTNWPAIALLIFAAGAGFFLLRLLISNLRAISLIRKSEKARLLETVCCVCNQEVHPFSFFNQIIIPREVLNSEHLPVILQHELIHVHEQHTIDVFTTELLFLLQWFNPFAWLLKDALKNNLEYLTDDQIIQTTNRQHYQLAMLAMADKEGVAPFLTALNGSQLKDRILMMKQKTTKNRSGGNYCCSRYSLCSCSSSRTSASKPHHLAQTAT